MKESRCVCHSGSDERVKSNFSLYNTPLEQIIYAGKLYTVREL
jgi:hypothetical protein